MTSMINISTDKIDAVSKAIQEILRSGVDSRTMQEALKTLRKSDLEQGPISISNCNLSAPVTNKHYVNDTQESENDDDQDASD